VVNTNLITGLYAVTVFWKHCDCIAQKCTSTVHKHCEFIAQITPPTPCQSLTTTETLCTHLVWRQKKVTRVCMTGSGIKNYQITSPSVCQLRCDDNWISYAVSFLTTKRQSIWNIKSQLFVENGKIQLMSKIMNHLFTYYLNCVGKSNPVCLIQQLPLVILLASYVQWLYFLIWPGNIDPFIFFHLC